MSKKRSLSNFKTLVLGLSCLVFFLTLGIPWSALAGQASHPVINQIQIDGLGGAGGTEDDWVELFNPTSEDISLEGWSIQKASSNGATSSPYKEALDKVIPAHGYYLIVRNNALTTASLKNLADHLASDSFSLSAGNIVSLVNDNTYIQDYNDVNIVDYVGFGTAKFFEGSSAAPAIPELKSIKRSQDGEDTDQNGADFIVENTPLPRNSLLITGTPSDEISGNVLLTIHMPGAMAAHSITGTEASIMFETNDESMAQIAYGLDASYGSFSEEITTIANTPLSIDLHNLQCDTVYHYSIQVVSIDEIEADNSLDQTFTTLPCGLELDSLVMTKANARANNIFSDGWEWRFNISVFDTNETSLKMKFDPWLGDSLLEAASNMQYSADNGLIWQDITTNSAYPMNGSSIAGLDKDTVRPGRQIEVIVRMKVPFGTLAGFYKSNYSILTE